MVIDGHGHACGDYYNDIKILQTIHSNNVDKVVLCPGEANSQKNYNVPFLSEKFPNKNFMPLINDIIVCIAKFNGTYKYMDEINNYVYEICKKCPEKIIQAYWINPLDKECIEKLEKDYERYKFKVIKLHQCWNKFEFNSEVIEKIVNWAQRYRMPIFIHISSKKQVKEFIKMANIHCDNVFIVAHLIGYEEIYEGIKGSNNIYYEISSPQLISFERLKSAVCNLGADKVILGSDTPYGKNNLSKNIERINNLNISDEEKCMIKGENMSRILFDSLSK